MRDLLSRRRQNGLESSETDIPAIVKQCFIVGSALNLEQSADSLRLVAEVLYAQGWTPADMQRATHDILASPDLMQTIRFAGSVTPEVYAAWRTAHRPGRLCACGGTPVGAIEGEPKCGDCWPESGGVVRRGQ